MDRSTVGQVPTEFRDDSAAATPISSSKMDAIINAFILAITTGEGAYAAADGSGINARFNAIVAGALTTIIAVSDWDDYFTDGFYSGDSLSNACTGTGATRFCIVIARDATNASQIQWDIAGGDMYKRDYASSVWGAWVQISGYTPPTALTVLEKTGDYTMLSTDHQSVITNEGSGASSTITLSAPTAGLEITCIVQAAQTFEIAATAGKTIRNVSAVTSSGGSFHSAVPGSFLKLVAINTTEWMVTSIGGVWSFT